MNVSSERPNGNVMDTPFNVLISSAGRRVQLLDAFRGALRALDVHGRVLAIDASPMSPAYCLADDSFVVPLVTEDSFIPEVLHLCKSRGVRLVIPTIDTELAAYASATKDFLRAGIVVAVSDSATISIASDKRDTHRWLESHGFPTVQQDEALDLMSGSARIEYPALAKPAVGSMSRGVRVIHGPDELRPETDADTIVQSIAPGDEHTVSVLLDRNGRCRAAVPRLRLEVRAGEVSKGRTVRDNEMEELAVRIAQALPGTYGALNIQIFRDKATGELKVIEINARFGGGDPLAWAAGADFPRWMIEELLGRGSEPRFDAWEPHMTMLRFDRAVYVKANGTNVVG